MYNYCRFEFALKRASEIYYEAYIKLNEELILYPKQNIYFRLDNIHSDLQFQCKMLEYVSRSTCKGLPEKEQKYMREKLNKYFEQQWSKSDMELIYTYLGNGCNRQLCMQFIVSDYDLEILKKGG